MVKYLMSDWTRISLQSKLTALKQEYKRQTAIETAREHNEANYKELAKKLITLAEELLIWIK